MIQKDVAPTNFIQTADKIDAAMREEAALSILQFGI